MAGAFSQSEPTIALSTLGGTSVTAIRMAVFLSKNPVLDCIHWGGRGGRGGGGGCKNDSDKNDIINVAPLPTQKGTRTLRPTDLSAEGAQGRLRVCALHVLPVVRTSRQPTPPHVTAHTSPDGGCFARGGRGGGLTPPLPPATHSPPPMGGRRGGGGVTWPKKHRKHEAPERKVFFMLHWNWGWGGTVTW